MTITRKVPNDPELFDFGLDFYFGVLDSMCGLRGAMRSGDDSPIGASQAVAHERMRALGETATWAHTSSRPLSGRPPDAITDRQLSAFAFGRQVWAAFTQLPWGAQELLRGYYGSAHALAAMAGAARASVDYGPVWVEADIRAAHRAYRALANAGTPPVALDQDVSGSTDRAKYRERGAGPRTAAERKRAQRARDAVEHEHNGGGRARRYAKEDVEAREAVQGAEPYLCALHEGKNTVSRDAFAALVRYFVEDSAEQWRAIKQGRFATAGGRVEIVLACPNGRKLFVAA